MLRFSLNDSLLLTVFLPGAILLFGIGWFLFYYPSIHSVWEENASLMSAYLQSGGSKPSGAEILLTGFLAIAAFLGFFLAVFLGSVLGTIVGFAEPQLLDRLQRCRLRLEPDEYQQQWRRYLDSLEKAHNSYVTKQVNAFHFQARSALALMFLFLFVLFSSNRSLYVLVPAFILAIFLSWAAIADHYELAAFRQRRFGVKPDPTSKPEALLGLLVDAWCKRTEVRPLKIILSVLSADRKEIDKPAEALAALQRVAELPDSEVLPTEKCMVCLAIAALTERTSGPAGGRFSCYNPGIESEIF